MTAELTAEDLVNNTKNDIENDVKLKEFLKQVDGKYYHRKIENRLEEIKRFPLLGENGQMFINTYQYVHLVPKLKKKPTNDNE